MTSHSAILTADLHSPVVDAAMGAAADMLGMEMVFVGGLSDEEFSLVRVLGAIPGLSEGVVWPRRESMCHAMVAGAPTPTADAAHVLEYAELPPVTEYGVTSYIGVPIRSGDRVVGTLCGIDRRSVTVSPETAAVLTGLAGVIEAHVRDVADGVVIHRSPEGWRVGATGGLDLTSAMALADLLAEDAPPATRPARADATQLSEAERLRLSVAQLEHALAARVTVEQAIGVLSERQHLSPRSAFERLRKAARTRGRKVQDLAREVVASSTDPTVPLPPELAGRH